MNSKILSMAAFAAWLVSCSDMQDVTLASEQDGDNRIQVALGYAPMDVITRGGTRTTETVTAKSFAGQEPTEANPFYPLVWFTATEGDYSVSDDAHHNKVKFTSSGLTFPDTDILYNTADKNALTYCFGLYPNNDGLWNLESSTAGWSPTPVGSVLYADITGQEDLMFAPTVSGCINDKFNSTIYVTDDPADKRLKFQHLLTWLKIRVNPAEQGAGAAWGKVKLIRVKTQQKVRIDLGTGQIYKRTDTNDAGEYQVPAFVPDPLDPVNPQQYKDLESETPEDPAIGSVLVVPDTHYEVTYQTEEMPSPKTIDVQMKDIDGNDITTVDEAKNKVFIISLFFYQRQKVEAQCTLEPMTDDQDMIYGTLGTPFTVDFTGAAHVYNGSSQTVTGITVKDGGADVSSDKYDILYSNNVNAGTAVVTAVGKGDKAGKVGTKTFDISKADGSGSISYTPATKSVTYGDDDFIHPLTNSLSWGGSASLLTYELGYNSSDPSVATVASDGTVHIIKAGSTTISANVSDGINHHWDSSPSASYDLTVYKAAGSISYTPTSLVKTYGDATFTHPLAKVGDGTVTYSSNNTDVATVDGASGQVTLQKAGAATITATVADGVNYKYAVPTATYDLTVEKGAGAVSFPQTNVTVKRSDPNFTIPASVIGDAIPVYSSSSNAVAGVSATGEITINGIGVAIITATVADTDKYAYDVKTVAYTLKVTAD